MSINLIFNVILIVCTSKLDGLTDLQWCGELGALEEYGANKMCCNKKVLAVVDEHGRKRQCCSNRLYYMDGHECVDGKIHSVNPPDPLPPDPTRTRTKEPKVRLCKMHFVYRLQQIYMTSNSDQHIRATVAGLNLTKLNMTTPAKWRKLKGISIYMDQSLYRKYVGKTVFVYCDKNLLRENS